jgi:hypothetical protein
MDVAPGMENSWISIQKSTASGSTPVRMLILKRYEPHKGAYTDV